MPHSFTAGRRARLRTIAAALALLTLLVAVTRYATAETGPAQAALRPSLIVVPADDGQSVFVQAGGVGQLGGQVFTNLQIGPSGNKGSYTMTYSGTVESYVSTIPGFAASQTESATLSITTTAGLDSGDLVFTRALVPRGQLGDLLTTEDGALSLSAIYTDTFFADTYLAAAPSYAPPGPPPAGLRLASRAYSLRASGALALADRPMSLRLGYSPDALSAAERAALAIYAWDPFRRRWDAVGGTNFPGQGYVSAPVERFTFYALMTTGPHSAYLPAVQR